MDVFHGVKPMVATLIPQVTSGNMLNPPGATARKPSEVRRRLQQSHSQTAKDPIDTISSATFVTLLWGEIEA
jgi:hypothetical protein